MSKILVIVESPGKIKKIEEYLNSLNPSSANVTYIVKASYGCCRDLNSKELSIDIGNNFEPTYTIIQGKEKVIKELKGLAKDCSKVILAADEDREGEMIASSLKDLLKLKNCERIVFHEITKPAIKNAIENPTTIDYNMVYAQQARRLLDRLVGYKITPILWKKMQGQLSAGRVQSVVVKIIVDKETEIKNAISNPYFKTSANFEYKKTKFNGSLMMNKSQKGDLYKFENKEDAEEFLKSITQEDEFTVKNISVKDSIRKASPPFTTSTLQQDSSTKLHFNVKRTMDAAQKLYEAGYITYMRTDSTNLSQQAQDECKEFIIKTYGKTYSDPKNFNKKSKGAQEAHEAIRPTNVSTESTEGRLSSDSEKVYKLIRNRTLASQMSNAIVEVQTLDVDLLTPTKRSKLPNKSIFISTLENITFQGFLILYNNVEVNDNESDTKDNKEKQTSAIDIKKDKAIKYSNISVNEEYSKLPLRFNEAGLVKNLEKNGIGRPSTYASIISKIMDRNYVEIKNIDGFRKNSEQMNITKNKKEFKYTVKTKEIVIGKESQKISPTKIGETVTAFMVENFEPIMQVDFTAKFEKYLDKIAVGEAKWFNVLDKFYKMFSPIVDELNKNLGHIENLSITDRMVGKDKNGAEIFQGEGKYGPYVKILEEGKWKFAPIKDSVGSTIDVEGAMKLLLFPKYLGKYNKSDVYLHKGQFGLYLKYSKNTISIKDETKDEDNVDLVYAKTLIESGDPHAMKSFKMKDTTINVKKGPYGYYAQISTTGKNKKRNVSLPEGVDPDKITLEQLLTSIGYTTKPNNV
jgi:DNA topoisomerase-1